ncbi:MAG: divergent polysaccharide deacetylase family protein [Mariprofundus sp.]
MSNKRGRPLWLAITLFLLLAGLLAIAMLTELSDVRSTMISESAQPPAAATKRQKQPVHHHSATTTIPLKTELPKEPLQPAPVIIEPEPIQPTKPVAGISLIIDDVGYDLPALRRILALNVPVAISIIPDTPHARQAARMAHKAKQMVMLHLPMQPESEKYSRNMGPAFLHTGMNQTQLRTTFMQDLAMIPYVKGVNNHMGSALTQLEQPMRWVMQLCMQQGLFFIDSKTSAKSVADDIAAEMGLSHASRQFFLDNDLNQQALMHAWEKVRNCARRGDSCIIIAHPHPETVVFLERHLSDEDRALMQPVSSMLKPAKGLALTLQMQQRLAAKKP